MGDQRSNERKVDKRDDHFGIPALDIAIGEDVYKTLFKFIMRQDRQVWERLLVRQRNFGVDLVEFSANISNGSPCEIA